MFIGHYAVGLAAKRWAPKASLGSTFMACQLLDLIWPVLVLLGIETVAVDRSATAFTPLDFIHYPVSHSLAMALVWGLVFGFFFSVFTADRLTALKMVAVVFSHWVLDFLTHRPDLPLLWFEPKVGLGLWYSKLGTVVFEVGLFAAAIAIYLKEVSLPTRKAKWIFWSLVSFLFAVYMANAFGPPPPDGTPGAVIAAPALAMWLFVFWAAWVEKNSGSKSR